MNWYIVDDCLESLTYNVDKLSMEVAELPDGLRKALLQAALWRMNAALAVVNALNSGEV